MSISEPVFFLIDPYSAFHALFAANLVSHNSVFLQRPKTERPRWTECHAAMSVGGCWYFLEKCWKTGGKRTRCPRQPIRAMEGACRRPRHVENCFITFPRKFTHGNATSRRDVPFAVGVRGDYDNPTLRAMLPIHKCVAKGAPHLFHWRLSPYKVKNKNSDLWASSQIAVSVLTLHGS